jgi:hypothetical protein
LARRAVPAGILGRPASEKEMRAAAKRLEFEEAAALRELREIQIYAG